MSSIQNSTVQSSDSQSHQSQSNSTHSSLRKQFLNPVLNPISADLPPARDRKLLASSSVRAFEGAHHIRIEGGTFNNVAGDQVIYMDNSKVSASQFHSHTLKSLTEQNERFRSLHRVSEAAYNSSAREFAPECLPHTRKKVLEKIHAWVKTEGTLLFWLNGVAGTGKSTIAHTIAKYYDQGPTYGASFFFSRDQQERREIRYLFQTIAFQMGNAHPALKLEISKALENEGILTSNLRVQLQKLILDPITRLRHLFPLPILVTLDALDECEQNSGQEHPVTHIIKLLVTELKDRELPLKFFLTSRPEDDIRSTFEPSLVGSATSPFVLHDVEPSEVGHDIGIFVKHELAEIAERSKEVLKGVLWPEISDIERLVEISAGLFIAAATAVKFVRQNDVFSGPRDRLDTIFRSSSGTFSVNANPFSHLDHMYTQVLKSAIDDKFPPAAFPQLRLLVATIVLGYGRLTIHELACLLSQQDHWVALIIGKLRSVIVARDDGPVRAFHLSFHDYLTTKHRCLDARFFIGARYYHREIARACLQRMTSLLKEDVCQIGDRTKLNNDLDLNHIVRKYLPGDLQYSCRFWALHLAECDPDKSLLKLLDNFAFGHLLHWMEALSLMGDLGDGIKSLKIASSQLSLLLEESNYIIQRLFHKQLRWLIDILRDAERFLFEFFDVIHMSALHVYYSALPFTPKQTLLYRTYSAQLTNAVQVVNGASMGENWNANSRVIDGHSDIATSVAISHDGTCIVSGFIDNTVQIWDAHSGASWSIVSVHLSIRENILKRLVQIVRNVLRKG